MKKNQFVTLGVVAVFVGVLFFINRHEPIRVSEQRKKEAAEAQRLLDEAEGKKQPTNLKQAVSQSVATALKQATTNTSAQGSSAIDAAIASVTAPVVVAAAATAAAGTDVFQVEFQCSNGTFIVEVHPEWAPLGAAQFRQAVEDGVYNEARFFRVIPGFMAQFGIPADPEKTAKWNKKHIQDEPVKTSNARGTVTYAMSSQPNSRTTQLFINYGNNANLDGMKFCPFGKVVKGMEVVDKINAEHGEKPDQHEMETRGNAYLKEYFPKLDYIKEAKILGAVASAAQSAPAPRAPAPAPATRPN